MTVWASEEPKDSYSDQFVEARNSPKIALESPQIPLEAYYSCVKFAKLLVDYNEPVGFAKNWPINSGPVVGGIVITKENPEWGHVAYITDIQGDVLFLDETNYVPGKRTQRQLLLSSPLILGFWSKPSSVPLTLSLSGF